MGLEKILNRIHAEGEQQAAGLMHQAEENACALLDQARAEANGIYKAAYREALLPAEGACARLLNEARFEANCLRGDACEQFIEAVLAQLRMRIGRARESIHYPQVMRRLLREVLPATNGRMPLSERVIIEADPRDRILITRLAEEMNLNVEVHYVLECLGGLNACTIDRSMRVVNTLDSRMERALPHLRRVLASQFEETISRQSGVETEPAGQQNSEKATEGHPA